MWQPIQKSRGITESERYLTNLSEKTFLSLWAYPNLYRREGQELCDLLVVFNNNIIIFSDKDIQFPPSNDIKVSWKRWFKKSVMKSAQQIYGAERWIKQYPTEIYLDSQCERRFPLEIQKIANPSFFRIAVTKNSFEIAQNYFGEKSTGSFIITTNVIGDDHYETPFVIGNLDPNKGYVHILDEFTLDIVLKELDTVYDFVSYLAEKERLLEQRQFTTIAGEEELLAYYLLSMYQQAHPALMNLNQEFKTEEFAAIGLGEGFWQEYSSRVRQAFKKANEISYFWDTLIEHFSIHIIEGTVADWTENNIASHEEAVRVLAAEGRLARRILAKDFLEKINQVPLNQRSSRICHSPTYKDTGFILVLFPKDPDESYETYRRTRIALLHSYGLVCKHKFPQFRYIAVVGMEPGFTGLSEEIIVFDIPELQPKDIELAKRLSKEANILYDTKTKAIKEHITVSKREKLGRNELCPCGSGRKYKKCCFLKR